MQRGFPSTLLTTVHVRTALHQKLTQSPVPVKSRSVETQVLSARLERLALRKEKLYSGHVAIVSTPLHQRAAIARLGTERMSLGKIVKD
jgi:hypothetical protein